MVLPLAVFGCIDHSALGQQQVHVGACVFRTLIALQKGKGNANKSKEQQGLQRWCMYAKAWLHACLKSILTNDGELFGPLSETFLAQQEGTDTTVPGRRHWALIWGPLMSELDFRAPFFLIFLVGLIGTAQGIWVIVWNNKNGNTVCCITNKVSFNLVTSCRFQRGIWHTWVFAAWSYTGGGIDVFSILVPILYRIGRAWPDCKKEIPN